MRLLRAYRRPLTCLWISSTTTSSLAVRSLTTTSGTPRRSFALAVLDIQIQIYCHKSKQSSSHDLRNMSEDNNDNSSSSSSNHQLRVALCQFHVTEDKDLNLQTCASYLDQAAARGAKLVVLPEIWNSPYAVSAFGDYAEKLPEAPAAACPESPSAEMVRAKAAQHGLWIVGGSIPERVVEEDSDDDNDNNSKLYNTCLVFDPSGTVVAKHRKVHLFDIDVPGGITFLESETLTGGSTVTSFETPWCTIGVGICYDIRFPEYAMLLAQQPRGCQILVYPGAFNLTTGPAHWELLQRGRAVDNQVFVLTASPARTAEPANGQQQQQVPPLHGVGTFDGHRTVGGRDCHEGRNGRNRRGRSGPAKSGGNATRHSRRAAKAHGSVQAGGGRGAAVVAVAADVEQQPARA